jgi:antitoxin FitA
MNPFAMGPSMPNLSIKDVPDAWAEALRRRAAANHRSLQGELMAIVEQAIGETAGSLKDAEADRGRPRVVGYDRRGWPVVRQGWMTPEALFAQMRADNVQAVLGQPLGVDIIREDRDAR